MTWRAVARPAGAGYFLCGDAAAVLDPLSSHGVLKALMSGMMAAHQIALVSAGRRTEREAADAYNAWLAGWFASDVSRLRELYSVFGRRAPSGGARASVASRGGLNYPQSPKQPRE